MENEDIREALRLLFLNLHAKNEEPSDRPSSFLMNVCNGTKASVAEIEKEIDGISIKSKLRAVGQMRKSSVHSLGVRVTGRICLTDIQSQQKSVWNELSDPEYKGRADHRGLLELEKNIQSSNENIIDTLDLVKQRTSNAGFLLTLKLYSDDTPEVPILLPSQFPAASWCRVLQSFCNLMHDKSREIFSPNYHDPAELDLLHCDFNYEIFKDWVNSAKTASLKTSESRMELYQIRSEIKRIAAEENALKDLLKGNLKWTEFIEMGNGDVIINCADLEHTMRQLLRNQHAKQIQEAGSLSRRMLECLLSAKVRALAKILENLRVVIFQSTLWRELLLAEVLLWKDFVKAITKFDLLLENQIGQIRGMAEFIEKEFSDEKMSGLQSRSQPESGMENKGRRNALAILESQGITAGNNFNQWRHQASQLKLILTSFFTHPNVVRNSQLLVESKQALDAVHCYLEKLQMEDTGNNSIHLLQHNFVTYLHPHNSRDDSINGSMNFSMNDSLDDAG